jgi:hypothetical protein
MKALEQCLPENGAICEVHDEECYANIIWKDEVVPKPSEEEVMAKVKELEEAEPMRILRIKRKKVLTDTDKYMTMDYPMTDEERDAMRTYRQELRDLPQKGITEIPEPPLIIKHFVV